MCYFNMVSMEIITLKICLMFAYVFYDCVGIGFMD